MQEEDEERDWGREEERQDGSPQGVDMGEPGLGDPERQGGQPASQRGPGSRRPGEAAVWAPGSKSRL